MRKALSIFVFALGLAIGVAVSVVGESRLVPTMGISQGDADGRYVNLIGDSAMTGAHSYLSAILTAADAAKAAHVVTRGFGDTRYMNVTGDTMTGSLVVEGELQIGKGVAQTVLSEAGSWLFPNITTITYNAATTFDATGQTVACKGTWAFADTITVPDATAATEAINQQTGDARYMLAFADVAIVDGGTGASTATAAFDALSPLSAKGDTLAYSTTNVRVPVGIDGQFLTANSGAAAGVAWASNPIAKSGTVAGGSFAGNPKVFTVTFNTAFPDTNYAVTIAGEDNRTFTYQTKLAGSFIINTNANLVIAGNVDWTATAHNDP